METGRLGDKEMEDRNNRFGVPLSLSPCMHFTRPASLAAQPQTRLFKLFFNLWIVSFGSSGWYVSLL